MSNSKFDIMESQKYLTKTINNHDNNVKTHCNASLQNNGNNAVQTGHVSNAVETGRAPSLQHHTHAQICTTLKAVQTRHGTSHRLNHDFSKINRISKIKLINNQGNQENLNKIKVQDKEISRSLAADDTTEKKMFHSLAADDTTEKKMFRSLAADDTTEKKMFRSLAADDTTEKKIYHSLAANINLKLKSL